MAPVNHETLFDVGVDAAFSETSLHKIPVHVSARAVQRVMVTCSVASPQVVFHHVAAADNDTEDEEVTTPYARSGNPGNTSDEYRNHPPHSNPPHSKVVLTID